MSWGAMRLGARARLNLRQFRNANDQILKKVGSEMRSLLMQRGAVIRRVAQKSMVEKDKPTPAGKPPRRITGLLSDWIMFKWDPSTESVVVGPTYMAGRLFLERVETQRWVGPRGGIHTKHTRIFAPRPVRPTVPEILEAGGMEKVWTKTKTRTNGHPETAWKAASVKIPAHPYMAPAFERSRAVYPKLWAASVT